MAADQVVVEIHLPQSSLLVVPERPKRICVGQCENRQRREEKDRGEPQGQPDVQPSENSSRDPYRATLTPAI